METESTLENKSPVIKTTLSPDQLSIESMKSESVRTGESSSSSDQLSIEKSFTLMSDLKEHINVHISENQFKCKACGKQCINAGGLSIHKYRMHSFVRPYSCNNCEKSFITRKSLDRHIKLVHSGDKLFSCPDCGKAFICQSNLSRHRETLTCEKPFPCSGCGRRFSSRYSRVSHTCTHEYDWQSFYGHSSKYSAPVPVLKKPKGNHTDNKVPCSDCGKHFVSGHHLAMHKKRFHTGVKEMHKGGDPTGKVPCSLCGKYYASRRLLARHKKRIHAIVKKEFSCKRTKKKSKTILNYIEITPDEYFGDLSVKEEFDPLGDLSVNELDPSETSIKEEVDPPDDLIKEGNDPSEKLIKEEIDQSEELMHEEIGPLEEFSVKEEIDPM